MLTFATQEINDAASTAKLAVRAAAELIRLAKSRATPDDEIRGQWCNLNNAINAAYGPVTAAQSQLPGAVEAVRWADEVREAYGEKYDGHGDGINYGVRTDLNWGKPLPSEIRRRLAAMTEIERKALFTRIDAEAESGTPAATWIPHEDAVGKLKFGDLDSRGKSDRMRQLRNALGEQLRNRKAAGKGNLKEYHADDLAVLVAVVKRMAKATKSADDLAAIDSIIGNPDALERMKAAIRAEALAKKRGAA